MVVLRAKGEGGFGSKGAWGRLWPGRMVGADACKGSVGSYMLLEGVEGAGEENKGLMTIEVMREWWVRSHPLRNVTQSHLESGLGVQQREIVDQSNVTGAQLVIQPELVTHCQRGKRPAVFQDGIGYEWMGDR